MFEKQRDHRWIEPFFTSYMQQLNYPEIGKLQNFVTVPVQWVNGAEVTSWLRLAEFEDLMIQYVNWMSRHQLTYHSYSIIDIQWFSTSLATVMVRWDMGLDTKNIISQFCKLYHLRQVRNEWRIYAIVEGEILND